MGSDAGAPAGGVQGGEAAQQQDNAQAQAQAAGLTEQDVQQLHQGLEDLRQMIQAQQQQPAEEQQPELEPIDLSEFLDPASTLDPEAQAQRLQEALDAHVEQRVQHAVQQIVGPLQEQVGEIVMQSEMDRLVSELPFLGRDPGQAEQMVKSAMQLAEAEGWGSQVGTAPGFLRLVALAGVGLKAMEAEREGDAGTDPVTHLETPGGAGPAGGSGAGLTAEQIVQARGRLGADALPL